ncbi:transcription initiation factor IIA subunit 2, partial [Tanacetum coccineum]
MNLTKFEQVFSSCWIIRLGKDERAIPSSNIDLHYAHYLKKKKMATFELYRRSTIGMCLTETLDEMVSNG